MKNNFYNMFIQHALKAVVCVAFLAGSLSALAQDENGSTDTVSVAKRFRPKKKAPVYEMKQVRGIVTDQSTGNAMGGVRVQALGNSKYSALTEEDGTYTVQVPVFVNALYIYAPEYTPVQAAIKPDGVVNVQLISDVFKAFYGEGTTITAEKGIDVVRSSAKGIEDELQTQLGADLHSINRSGMPAQGAFMHVRGINSINANTQPLVVLDGNIIDPQYGRDALHEGFFTSILAGIDPETVESVRLLKNATALYGAKGANGVIIITTKRGKSMATKINVNIFGGVELAPKRISMMSGDQFRNYISELITTNSEFSGISGAEISSGESIYTKGKFEYLNDNPNIDVNQNYNIYHNNTDWSEGLYRKAWTQNYKVNVEGGDERGMYALQLGYTKSDATSKGNDFSRLSLRFNTDLDVFKNLTAGVDIAYSQTSYNLLDQGWSNDYSMQNIGSPNVLGLIQTPFINRFAYASDRVTLSEDLTGKYASSESSAILNPFRWTKTIETNFSMRNPDWIVENGHGKNKNYAQLSQILLNFAPRWQINKHLVFSDRFSYTMYRNSERYFLPTNGANSYELKDLGSITSVLGSSFSKESIITNDARIEWQNTYGAHSIKAFGGWRFNNFSYSNTNVHGYNNENDKLPVINASMSYVNYDGTKDNWRDMTWYLDGQYNYANRFFAEFGVSAMSSSRFGNNTKGGFHLGGVSWGVFPSLQLGWVLSNEKWFPTKSGINYLKLTAGVDQSGNDEIDYYAAKTYWESQLVSKTVVGLVLQNIANSSIQWETTTKWNVGLEGSFLNNRLNAGLDLYWHKTSNLLMRTTPHYLIGLNNYWSNDGEMTNKGFEIHANAALVNTRNFKWELGASVGHYTNKITKMPTMSEIRINALDANGAVQSTEVINGYTSSVYGKDNVLTAVGHPIGSFYGYQTKGVFASNADAQAAGNGDYLKYYTGTKDADGNIISRPFKGGDVHFVDQNGDGWITEADKVVIGNPNPDVYGNIFTSLTYRNLRLDVIFKYSLGNDIFNYQRSQIEAGSNLYNQTVAMVNRWRYDGQQAAQPRAVYTNSNEWVDNERFSDRWIEDGSYLKLKNIRLTYTVPVHTTWLQGLKIWAEGNNLFTMTKYLGVDPETSSSNNTYFQGIDTGMTSVGRSFNVGLSINL